VNNKLSRSIIAARSVSLIYILELFTRLICKHYVTVVMLRYIIMYYLDYIIIVRYSAYSLK